MFLYGVLYWVLLCYSIQEYVFYLTQSLSHNTHLVTSITWCNQIISNYSILSFGMYTFFSFDTNSTSLSFSFTFFIFSTNFIFSYFTTSSIISLIYSYLITLWFLLLFFALIFQSVLLLHLFKFPIHTTSVCFNIKSNLAFSNKYHQFFNSLITANIYLSWIL